jgi:hypothetical protein
MLWKLAESLHKQDGPTHLAVIFDASAKTFRNDMYGEYKANRPPPPPDLVPQFPLIRDATRAFSLPCIEEDGLGSGRHHRLLFQGALEQGWKVTIVSSDKDLMQLIEDGRLDMLDTMNDRRSTGTMCSPSSGRAGAARRGPGADGRQRRQCPRRSRHRTQDRRPADPAIWQREKPARPHSTRSPSPS